MREELGMRSRADIGQRAQRMTSIYIACVSALDIPSVLRHLHAGGTQRGVGWALHEIYIGNRRGSKLVAGFGVQNQCKMHAGAESICTDDYELSESSIELRLFDRNGVWEPSAGAR